MELAKLKARGFHLSARAERPTNIFIKLDLKLASLRGLS